MQDPRAHKGSFSLTWKTGRRWPVVGRLRKMTVWTGQLWKNRRVIGNSQREGGACSAELGQEQKVLGRRRLPPAPSVLGLWTQRIEVRTTELRRQVSGVGEGRGSGALADTKERHQMLHLISEHPDTRRLLRNVSQLPAEGFHHRTTRLQTLGPDVTGNILPLFKVSAGALDAILIL